MLKRNWLKSATLTAVIVGMLLLTACGDEPTKKNTDTPSQSTSKTTIVETETTTTATPFVPSVTEAAPSVTSPEAPSDPVAKINGGADENGIYSIVVRLTDEAADKGAVEMVYHGAKGSPQENSIVNTFRIEYYKEATGMFEIRTFFNGEVYQNLHHKDEVKVTNTFDATLRAGDVTITYTPDGGEAREIFKEDADYFYVPTN